MPLCRLGLLLTVVFAVQICPLSALPAAANGSHSPRADRDHDTLTNRFERLRSHTNPRRRDTDRDRLSDGYEVRRSHTNPRRRDTDRDGLNDRHELLAGSNPVDSADPARVSAKPRDTTPPQTSITSGPSGTVTSLSASFSFSGSDNASRGGRLTFECRLDGGSWGACVSPRAYDGLGDGPHTFEVRAKDAAGNVDLTPASRTWTSDSLDAAFTYSPGSPFAGDAVTFDATASKCMSTPCQYEWVDEGADGPGGSTWPLGSGRTLNYTFNEPGTKHARLTVTDSRGASSSTEEAVVVTQPLDVIAPETTVTSSPPASTTSTSASFAFTSTEASSSFECRLDAGTWVSCASPTAYSNLAAGGHTFSVRATDLAGNIDPSPASFAWTVQASDTTPPDTSISAGPSGTVSSATASLSFSSTESGSTFECRLDAGSWGACSSPKAYSSLADGSHTFEVRATDAGGNLDASPASPHLDRRCDRSGHVDLRRPLGDGELRYREPLVQLDRIRVDLRVPPRRRLLGRVQLAQGVLVARRRLPHLRGARDRRRRQPRREPRVPHLDRRCDRSGYVDLRRPLGDGFVGRREFWVRLERVGVVV